MNTQSTDKTAEAKVQAKEALISIVKMNVKRYLTMQGSMMDLLASGAPMAPDKKTQRKKGKKHIKSCNFCKLNAMITSMSSYKDVAAEAIFHYNNLFDEDLDLDTIFEEMDNKMNSSGEFVLDKDGTLIMPADAPEEVKAMMTTIQEALNKNGMGGNMSMEVINLKADNYGLKPEDFPDFVSYAKAVSAKRAEAYEKNKGKSGEEIINEAVILNAEKAVDSSSENAKEKLN